MPAKDLMILGNHIDKDYLVKTQREFNMIMEHILSFAELSQFTACQTFFTKNCINMEEIGEESKSERSEQIVMKFVCCIVDCCFVLKKKMMNL